MKRIRTTLLSLAAVIGLALTPAIAGQTAFAQSCQSQDGSASTNLQAGLNCVGGSSNKTDLAANIKTIVNIMLFLLGAIAVIMIIIGGIRYSTSNGDASATKAAKDTVLYAVVGLVVAILAYAIVNFVITQFAGK